MAHLNYGTLILIFFKPWLVFRSDCQFLAGLLLALWLANQAMTVRITGPSDGNQNLLTCASKDDSLELQDLDFDIF